MGHPLDDLGVLDQFGSTPLPPGYPSDRRTFFSPVDDCHGALIYLLANAQSSIDLAMYAFTDVVLCQTIVAAVMRGVKVRLTLDWSQFSSDKEIVKLHNLLTAAGVDVTIGTSERGQIMHLKSGVIDGTIVFTGSTNWSTSGEELQDNSLTVFLSPYEAVQFRARFDGIHAYQKAHPKGEPHD